MPVEIIVPSVGESISEVQIGVWLKKEGDTAVADEALAEIESDKATLELPSPVTGVVSKILVSAGETAKVGQVIGYMEEGKVNGSSTSPDGSRSAQKRTNTETSASQHTIQAPAASNTEPAAVPAPKPADKEPRTMPSAERLISQAGINPADVEATGPGGRILKEDVLRAINKKPVEFEKAEAKPAAAPTQPAAPDVPLFSGGAREEEAVPMSPMRRTIAQRLVEAQQSAALLTTFNEVNMQAVMDLRKQYQDDFLKKYDIKLGLMSFFVKAVIEALKAYPAVNAQIRDDSIVYHNYYDIGIAVASGKGLVVPVLRNAELMSFAEVELAIADFSARAKENKISLEELKGGTFSITNGGVFGSMLSTPIINPPQSAILGMHAITDRPVAEGGQVVIRPMMYIALTYDHRIIDGREAVSFLKRIKDCVENPTRILLEV